MGWKGEKYLSFQSPARTKKNSASLLYYNISIFRCLVGFVFVYKVCVLINRLSHNDEGNGEGKLREKKKRNVLAPGWARTSNLSVNSRTR